MSEQPANTVELENHFTVECDNYECAYWNEHEMASFSQARRWAREHVRHTNHKVTVTRTETHHFSAED